MGTFIYCLLSKYLRRFVNHLPQINLSYGTFKTVSGKSTAINPCPEKFLAIQPALLLFNSTGLCYNTPY